MLTKYFTQGWIDAIGETKLMNLLGDINTALRQERLDKPNVLPPAGSELLFQAFRETAFANVKVVILGQDPYHDGSYNGLAFGNGSPDEPAVTKISPSLRAILNEVKALYGETPHPSLYEWARQGVLLINTAHSVVKGEAGSHIALWSQFTAAVIAAINSKSDIVWLLWCSNAHAYASQITNPTHTIIKSGHPSPLNRVNPFAGCGCFSECDSALMKKGKMPIQWV